MICGYPLDNEKNGPVCFQEVGHDIDDVPHMTLEAGRKFWKQRRFLEAIAEDFPASSRDLAEMAKDALR